MLTTCDSRVASRCMEEWRRSHDNRRRRVRRARVAFRRAMDKRVRPRRAPRTYPLHRDRYFRPFAFRNWSATDLGDFLLTPIAVFIAISAFVVSFALTAFSVATNLGPSSVASFLS